MIFHVTDAPRLPAKRASELPAGEIKSDQSQTQQYEEMSGAGKVGTRGNDTKQVTWKYIIAT